MRDAQCRTGLNIKADNTRTILEVLRDENVEIESGCITGRCKSCVVNLRSGSALDVRSGKIISSKSTPRGSLSIEACVHRPVSDIVVSTPRYDYRIIKPKKIPVKVCRKHNFGENRLLIVFRHPPSVQFYYYAGQWVNLIASSGLKRPYSIFKYDEERKEIYFYIDLIEDGEMSCLLKNIGLNTLMYLEGPFGQNAYHLCTQHRDIFFLVAGTGIAPAYSIITKLGEEFKINEYNLKLFWGNRFLKEFELPQLEIDSQIQLLRCCSREKEVMAFSGYVQDALSKTEIEGASDPIFYVCGSDVFINSVVSKLDFLGVDKHRIIYENFGE